MTGPLTTPDLRPLGALFRSPHTAYILSSALQGNTALRAWMDDARTPRAALAWDGTHGLLLGGEPAALRPHLPALLAAIRDEVLRAGTRYFKFTPDDPTWLPLLQEALPGSRPAARTLLRHEPQATTPTIPLPDGYAAHPITAALLAGQAEGNHQPVLEEVRGMWGDEARFLTRAFGFVATRDGTVTGWCTLEYLSDTACGVGVETVEEHQQRGIATALATLVAGECSRRGLTAHWDAWTRNVPSVRTAEKAGFTLAHEYEVLFASEFPEITA